MPEPGTWEEPPDDPTYRLRAIPLRWGLTFLYVVLVALGVLEVAWHSLAWSASIVAAHHAWYTFAALRPASRRHYDAAVPWLDAAVVTLVLFAVGDPTSPVWLLYFLIVQISAHFYPARLVLSLSASIAAALITFAGVELALDRQADWQQVALVAALLPMTALYATNLSSREQRLRKAITKSSELLEARTEQLERSLDEERARARRDPLTDTLNHVAIVDELERLIGESGASGSHAVALADVDALKATNDTFGHQVGDALLVAVAKALSRDGTVVGRYGGDEFVVLLPGMNRSLAEQYVEAVLQNLAHTQLTDPATDINIPVVASFGLASYPDEGESAGDLIKLADSAMYASRRRAAASEAGHLLSRERAAKLVSDIVPLLTIDGSGEDKLRLVAHHLSAGAGYDAVNFEVAGELAAEHAPWESTFSHHARGDLVDKWRQELSQAEEHPLGRALERTRRPTFLDLESTELLTKAERDVLREGGLKSALVVPMIWQDRMVGMLSVVRKEQAAFTSWDAQFLTAVASEVTAIVYMTRLVEELRSASTGLAQAHSETVMMLAAAAEAHDDTTGRHLQRVRAITEALSRQLGYSDQQAGELGLASVLHDIGKIRIPDTVLKSTQQLTDPEWVLMKQHPIWGGEFLSGRRGFELAALVARAHHERWDGSGYPYGLAGEEIPEAAAITAVADGFDAMTSDRPYRAGRPASEAVEEIVACSGKQFSPRVVDALVQLFRRRALPLVEVDHARERAAA